MNQSIPASLPAVAASYVEPLVPTRVVPRPGLGLAAAVSWSAILSGAAAASALWLVLLAFGNGLGLAVILPWGVSTLPPESVALSRVWLILMSAGAAAAGGYLSGRLRTRSAHANPADARFRDAAHGFLAWALATLMTLVLLDSAARSLVQSPDASSLLGANDRVALIAAAEDRAVREEYFVDALFRNSERPGSDADDYSSHLEAGRILTLTLQDGTLEADDRLYLARLVSARTGVELNQAHARVAAVVDTARATLMQIDRSGRERASADRARTASVTLWLFVALSIAAFCAAGSALLGSRRAPLRS